MSGCAFYHNFARDFDAALVAPIFALGVDTDLRENYLYLIEGIDALKKERDRNQASIIFHMIESAFDAILKSKKYHCDNKDFLLSLIKETKRHESFLTFSQRS